MMLNCSLIALMPGIAVAAGTYYNGNYNSPQRNYSTTGYATRAQNTSYSRDTTYTRSRTVTPNDNAVIGAPYQNYTRVVGGQQQTTAQTQTIGGNSGANVQKGDGFWLGAGFSHEFASWNFDMNEAGSKLHYDNIRWNVLDINAGYRFGDNTKMQVDAGFRYGMQFGDSSMVDDDITNGGYLVTEWWEDNGGGDYTYIGQQVGHSLSVGNSNDGDMMGFHIGFGLTDFMKLGAAKLTPSIGFRYLKTKLKTKQDYGLTVDTGYCAETSGGEVQCDPIVLVTNFDGNNFSDTQQVMWADQKIYDANGTWTGYWLIGGGDNAVTTGGTYMFKLPGVSHSYETTWMGPYLALDMDYEIDKYNLVNARFEVGLPIYKSTGDQPYRSDWQHPKSVEDEGSFGDAWHIGLGANYMTALTETVALTVGFTFDYYTMSGGKASTYLNSRYYMDIYNELLDAWEAAGYDEDDMLENDPTAQNIKQLESECSGWVCKVDNEIDSIYKSMGVRIGIQAKF